MCSCGKDAAAAAAAADDDDDDHDDCKDGFTKLKRTIITYTKIEACPWDIHSSFLGRSSTCTRGCMLSQGFFRLPSHSQGA